MKKILIIVGSLRKESYNKKLSLDVEKMLEGNEVMHADISQFPLFNEDIENPLPETVIIFKKQIEVADGIIFISPEYNRSISSPLKNALDWGTRPDGQNSFENKKFLVMGVSSGVRGTISAQHDLKKVLLYFGGTIVGQPEIYIGPAEAMYDTTKNSFNDKTLAVVKKGIDALLKI